MIEVTSRFDELGIAYDGVKITSPGLLYAYTYVMHGIVFLVVYRSSVVALHSELYTPVDNFLTEYPDATMVVDRTERDEAMYWNEAVYRLWLIGDADEVGGPVDSART